MTFTGSEVKALADPADDEGTHWDKDPNFQELATQSAQLFQAPSKPKNMKEFEVMLQNGTADQQYQFWNSAKASMGDRRSPMFDLSAISFYDGAELQDFIRRMKPIEEEYLEFVGRLRGDVDRLKGWIHVAAKIAAAYAEVFRVRKERRVRQVDAKIRKPYSECTAEEHLELCMHARELFYKSISEGNFDPVDSTDKSDEWKTEHERLEKVLSTQINGLTFSLGDFFGKYERYIETQREHMNIAHAHRLKFARCLVRVRQDLRFDEDILDAAIVESLAKSSFDAGSGTIIPYMSEVWCKLNWPYFGSSGAVHHTSNGTREYLYTHSTPLQVRAMGKAFYSLRPLSESLNYSSPFTYRQTQADIVAQAGVDAMEDVARDSEAAQEGVEWERDLAKVVRCARSLMGKIRRRRLETARQSFAASEAEQVTDVAVQLPEGQKSWEVGKSATVMFTWKPSELLAQLPADHKLSVKAEFDRRLKGTIEVSLWRKKTEADARAAAELIKEAHDLVAKDSRLKDVAAYTRDFHREVLTPKHLRDTETAYLSDDAFNIDPFLDNVDVKDDAEHQEWEFVTMLNDNIDLRERKGVTLSLPFSALRLSGKRQRIPDGEYRVKVRCFRTEQNPERHAARCVEGFSQPFAVTDTIEATITTFLGSELSADGFFPSTALTGLVEQLRSNSFAISIDTEFELGQCVTPKGQIALQYILNTLRSGAAFVDDPVTSGLSEDEIENERELYRHYEQWNPGATLDEWASRRRVEFSKAYEGTEVAWWVHDDAEEPIHLGNMGAVMQYMHDKAVCLSATGTCSMSPGIVTAEAEVEATGLVSQLKLNVDPGTLKFEDAIKCLHVSLNNAHGRLNTLAHRKLTPKYEETTKVSAELMQRHSGYGAQMAGKYMRTHYHCYETARRKVLGLSRVSTEAMWRNKPVERWGTKDYKFATARPGQKYRLGPHEAAPPTGVDHQWPN